MHDPTAPRPPLTVEALSRELHRLLDDTDTQAEETLRLVIALEEITFARWPRRILVRARWRRDVAASLRHIDGQTFTGKRLNTLGTGWARRTATTTRRGV